MRALPLPKSCFIKRFFGLFILQALVCGAGHAQQQGTVLCVTAGRESAIADGDSLFRAVFSIECPAGAAETYHLRVFDADVGGKLDRGAVPSKARYRLFAKGKWSSRLSSIGDRVDAAGPLFDLELGDDDSYDNQWRTVASFRARDGECSDSVSSFTFIIDGASGAGANLYQIDVSTDEKRNTPADAVRIGTAVASLFIPALDTLVTQIPFDIPARAKTLDVRNFDGDGIGEMFIQTPYREKVPVCVSENGVSCSTIIPVFDHERGKRASLVFAGKRSKADYVQCWISDDSGAPLFFKLPAWRSPMNRLPSPRFTAAPLSDGLTFVLDATGTTDPDGDEMSFQWFAGDRSIGRGPRIVHAFPEPGLFPVRLAVQDHSGFTADTKETTVNVRVNSAPASDFSAPAVAAPNEELVFDGTRSSDSDGRILRYQWNFGDGRKAVGPVARHAYAQPGRYRVALRVEDDSRSLNGSDEKTATVWVNAPPSAQIKAKTPVAVSENAEFDAEGSVDGDGEIVRYVWTFGGAAAAEGKTASHKFQTPGVYRIGLAVHDNSGAKNGIRNAGTTVVVNAPPVAAWKGPTVAAVGETVVLDASGSADPDGLVSQIRWDLGDGTVLTGNRIQHAYDKPGRYDVVLQVKDNSTASNGEDEKRFSIRANAPPVPDAGEDRIVNSSTVLFDAGASDDSDDGIVDYAWDFGDTHSAHGEKVSHTYALPGSYRVKLTVRDGSGTATAVQSTDISVVVNHPPVADAGGRRVVAQGESVAFDASFSHDPDDEIIEYRWTLEPGVEKEGKHVNHVFNRPGTVQVQLAVKDKTGAEDVHTTDIVVNAAPAVLIGPVPRAAPGQVMQLDGGASADPDGEIAEAGWDFGDGTPPAEGLKVRHAYANPGRYQAVLTVRDDSRASNGTASGSVAVSINHAPVPSAGPDQVSCSQTVHFDGSRSFDEDGDPLALRWNFGDSLKAEGPQATHTYKRHGAYLVRLTVDDGHGLSNSKSEMFAKVRINSPPVAVIDAQEEVCAGEPCLFDASRSFDPDKDPLKYVWNFGDGSAGEGVNPVHRYAKGGMARVLLTVIDQSGMSCDRALAETVVRIIDAPVADAGEDRIVCANRPVIFDGSRSSGGSRPIQSYEWDFGDGQQGGGAFAHHAFSRAGVYTVRLKIAVPPEGHCDNVSEDQLTVRVSPSPVAAFEFAPSGCPGADHVFDAGASKIEDADGARYEWDFGDSTAGTGIKAAHRYLRPGKYNVRLTVTTNAVQECNTAVLERPVLINARPHASIEITGSPVSLAPYSVVYFSGSSSEDADGVILKYAWNFGDGENAEGIFVKHQFKRAGVYRVRLSVQDDSETACSADTAEIPLTVSDLPVWSVNGPAAACAGQPVAFSLQTPGSAGAVTWFFSDGDTLTGRQISKTFQSAGKYQVQAFCDRSWSATRDIQIIAVPAVSLPPVPPVDVDEPVVISPAVDNPDGIPLKYQWDLGDGTRSDQPGISHAYGESGEKTIRLKIEPTDTDVPCLSGVQEIRVRVNAKPDAVIEISPDTLYTGGARDEATFTAVMADASRPVVCRWDFGDQQTASGPRVKHAYGRPGLFSVQLTVWDASRKSAKKYAFTRRIQVLSR